MTFITNFVETSNEEFVKQLSEPTQFGSNALMVAAEFQKSEVLMTLLKHLLMIVETENEYEDALATILHQTNRDKKNLLAITMEDKGMGEGQKMITEAEAKLHHWNEIKFQRCIYKHLGSCENASSALKMFSILENQTNGIAVKNKSVCETKQVHHGTIGVGQKAVVTLWYQAIHEPFNADCYFWCTKNGHLPENKAPVPKYILVSC